MFTLRYCTWIIIYNTARYHSCWTIQDNRLCLAAWVDSSGIQTQKRNFTMEIASFWCRLSLWRNSGSWLSPSTEDWSLLQHAPFQALLLLERRLQYLLYLVCCWHPRISLWTSFSPAIGRPTTSLVPWTTTWAIGCATSLSQVVQWQVPSLPTS